MCAYELICDFFFFSGNSTLHCGGGCDSRYGTCSQTKLTPDGSCGGAKGYICHDQFGKCCSDHGFWLVLLFFTFATQSDLHDHNSLFFFCVCVRVCANFNSEYY